MNQSCKKVKNKKGYLWFKYTNGSHNKLLSKFKTLRKLNAEIKTQTFIFIEVNQNTSFMKTRKCIYLSAEENEAIAEFCNKKKISRTEFAELIKGQMLYNNK